MQFLEGMQYKYSQSAEEAGVHIVGACGYDSIPAEMGLVHMMKSFKGNISDKVGALQCLSSCEFLEKVYKELGT